MLFRSAHPAILQAIVNANSGHAAAYGADAWTQRAERALAVLHHAIDLGLGEEFAESGLKAAFADGLALAEDRGLYAAARRAGLNDAQTATALADDSWRDRAEVNRAALLDAGLWGAPTFRVRRCQAHWGQDRLWMLEDDLRAATAPTKAHASNGSSG